MSDSTALLEKDVVRKTKELINTPPQDVAFFKRDLELRAAAWRRYMEGRKFRNTLEYKAVRHAFDWCWEHARISHDQFLEAFGRAYTLPEHASKVVDSELAVDVAKELFK